MRRPDTHRKLDDLAAFDRVKWMAAIAAMIVLGVVFTFVDLFPRTDLGDVAATVEWSEVYLPNAKSEPKTMFRAAIDEGKVVVVVSPHTPPPPPGERVVLRVDRNIVGWHRYSWIVGKQPALTEGAKGR